ncbi:cob(I)yrinic acid a,c-diamide adenosyltransferase [Gaoshiqia sediminis]|uniref:corrinoid adenosyltransferase n=1 Tax=Gaoshiqia sediminis TaxID=2986998 RepID=A0AA41Y988_9BACT|nr:cob(I)yrinic acid a,c-diamide adenosyltransferase [Gaoshiqia sediminis]MCW0481555.1 cob(I)yrinic acid a,c-diamide adenosyltransferase [Gaoshiqia sediminis]
MDKGYIHIYTGTGKGKTTAAVGLAARALGQGFRVVYAHFMKRPDVYGYTEIDSLKKLGATVMGFTSGHPFCDRSLTTDLLRQQMKEALVTLTDYLKTSPPDLLIMDEILITVRDGFLDEEALIGFIDQKPAGTELVLTGRGATAKLIDRADYVSEINKIKHPYDQGITSRRGIEF